jgi:hypothetical protein
LVGEKTTLHDVVRDVFTAICKRCGISCFMILDSCPFIPYLIIFMSSNWHCIIRCCHCQPHLNWFGFVGCYFLWGCCKNLSSCKGRYLLWLVSNIHVFSSSYIKRFSNVYTNRWTSFFIDVPTWCESEGH